MSYEYFKIIDRSEFSCSLSRYIFFLLFALYITLNSDVDAEICRPLVSPIVAPPVTNLPLTVELSFIVNPLVSRTMCSALVLPIFVVAAKVAY